MADRQSSQRPASMWTLVRDAARELFAQRRAEDPGAAAEALELERATAAGGEGGAGGAVGRAEGERLERREGEAVDTTAGLFSAALQRLREASGFARFLRPAGRDQVVGVGEHYELLATVDPVRGVVAEKVRFWAGGERLGEAEIRDGWIAWLDPAAGAPGLFEVETEVLGPGGAVLRGRDPQRAFRVQIVDEAPTVAVDASALLDREDEAAPALRALAEAGFVLFYLDLGEESRTERIRGALARSGLPDGAILSHPHSEAEFRRLGVDFRSVFATTALRRVRAGGVPLVAVISADRDAWRVAEREGVESLDLGRARAMGREERAALTRRARERREERRRADPLDFRLDAMTSARAVEGHACGVELDNRRAREAVLAAIEGARRSVHLSFYIFEEGWFTEHLSVRLIAAARRGVRVRLLVDALFSREGIFGLKNPAIDSLREEPGVEVMAFHPIPAAESLELLALKRRDHRKVIAIDGERAFVSGRNAGDAYYTGFDEVPITDFSPHARIPWLDAHMDVRGPVVEGVERAFAESWRRSGGGAIEIAEAPAIAGGSRARLVLDDGAGDAEAMGSYEAILDASERYVYLVNDFPIVSSLAAAVRRAVGRGVRVVLLTGNAVARRADGSFFRGPLFREMFEYMTKRRLEPLMSAGVSVVEYATPRSPLCVAREGVVRPYVHAKIAVADGRVASVGSANLDATTSYWEREANVIVQDPAVVAPLEDALRGMVTRGHEIDSGSAYWRAESTMREIASLLWPEVIYA